MAHQTRTFRKQVYRISPGRYAWRAIRRGQVRIVMRALEALYRRG
jgi:hypothetical protein